MSNSRKQIGILYGGKSVEHKVSINSARNLFQFMDRSLFEPVLLGIDQEGRWFHVKDIDQPINSGDPVKVDLGAKKGTFLCSSGTLSVDVAFPILHGTNGEDGSIQGLLQAMDMPFVGTGVLGSAVCMSKLVSKQLMVQHGLPTSGFLFFSKQNRDQINYDRVVEQLGLPFMVKSTSLGSSVGISKVTARSEFDGAVNDSFTYDDSILIEKFIEAREIECAVMGNGDVEVSNPGEIVIKGEYDFYTFDAKYVDPEAVTIDVPAQIELDIVEKIRDACAKAYKVLHCEDFARVDLFLKDNGDFYLNEINTIPGFTNSSMFPMMWKERGISFTDLITRLIKYSMERTGKQNEIERVFLSKLD